MNIFEKVIYALKLWEMEIPTAWGWFHWLWNIISIACIAYFAYRKNKGNKVNEKAVYAIFGFGSLILELLKQIMWSINYENGIVFWSYQWYAAPFQLCTTPMYTAILLVFINNKTISNALKSYLAYFTIISSFMVMVYPEQVFTYYALVDIHTMYLHCGGFVVSMMIHINDSIDRTYRNVLKGLTVFVSYTIIAIILNEVVYYTVDLGEGFFNMFYISPHFTSSLPVFDLIQQAVIYPIFLSTYYFAFLLGSGIVYVIASTIKAISTKTKINKAFVF